ncbi:MAG: hypothetical protein H0V80_07385, partial [Acidobacteria bacterium]|nr:hypothetical protein [Acidobacteriota bacterium]
FGTTYQPLFTESRPYDQASLDAATRYVERLEANLGGTELEPVLRFVLSQPARPDLPRQVVVLTDGAVTNTDTVIALAARHRQTSRVFTFGIGSAASQHLVRGLARAGGGAAEFIHPGERIETRVMRQFARLLAPAMTDVRIEWIGGDVTTAPEELAPVFAGQRLLAYGLVTGTMPSAARLTASLIDGVQTWDIRIDDAPVAGTIALTLAARTRIRELEESPEWTALHGSRQRGRKHASVRQQIIALAIRHGLMSRETSFVAVERRATPVIGEVQLRRVPVMLAHGWAGTSLRDFGIPGPMYVSSSRPLAVHWGDAADASAMDVGASVPSAGQSITRRSTEKSFKSRWGLSALSGFGRSARRPAVLDELVALQDADGSWALTSALARIVDRELSVLEARLPDTADETRRASATALAIVWLEVHASAWQDEWQLLRDKARRWLSDRPALERADWLDFARDILAAGSR